MGKIFRIQLLPARHGDAILVEYGDDQRPSRFLVDGGPLGAYPILQQRLEAVPKDQCVLELLVVTHIDGDHIEGALKLLNHSELVRFQDIWFNGWPHLDQPLQESLADSEADAAPPDAQRGVQQGIFLGQRIGNGAWNVAFKGRPIFVPVAGDLPTVELPGGMKITLLSPRLAELKTLRAAWSKTMDRLGLDPDDTQKLDRQTRFRGVQTQEQRILDVLHGTSDAIGKVDDAAANGSSVAFVAEYEGRRCAFMGDAHTAPVENALARMAKKERTDRVRLDAFKVPHHGSAGNINANVLARIQCDTYLVSTDGTLFRHPDDAAIEMIAQRSPGARLHFNYRSERTAIWDDARLQEKLGYSAHYPRVAEAGTVLDLLASSRG